MQLVYLIDIFKDNHNIVSDRFETDSVNLKNRPLIAKRCKEILIYINLAQSHQKTMELALGTVTLKAFVSYTGL